MDKKNKEKLRPASIWLRKLSSTMTSIRARLIGLRYLL